jgi:hypothetical protein
MTIKERAREVHERQIPQLLALAPEGALFDDSTYFGADGTHQYNSDPFAEICSDNGGHSGFDDELFPDLYPVERVVECKAVDSVLRNEMDRRRTAMKMDPKDETPRCFWDGTRYQPTMDLRTVNDGDSDRIRLYIKHLLQTLAQTGGFLREAHAEIAELEETVTRQGWGHAKEDDISQLEAKNAKLEKALKEQKLKTATAEAKLKKYETENPYKDALADKRREAFRMKKRMLQLNEMSRTGHVQEESVVCVVM